MSHSPLPRVGISSCLMGERVRYEGGHRRQAVLLTALSGRVDWVTTCPEVEIGLGVPRETIQIEAEGPSLRLVTSESRIDLTVQMESWAQERIAFLVAQGISGYVFKARSPSCGVDSVTVPNIEENVSGLFAAALVRSLPNLPVVEEEDLKTKASCELFHQRVHSYHQLLLTKVIG